MQTIKKTFMMILVSLGLFGSTLASYSLNLSEINNLNRLLQNNTNNDLIKEFKKIVSLQELWYSNKLWVVKENEILMEPNSLKYNNIIKTVGVNQKKLTEVYNTYPGIIRSYLNEGSCNSLNFKDESYNTKLLNLLTNNAIDIKIKLEPKQIAKYIWCYIRDKGIESKIETTYEEYRKINIGSWMERFNWYVMRPNETISVFKETFLDNKDNLVTWYALSKSSDWSIIEIPVLWWGICWISTIFYQNTLQNPSLSVVERRQHSRWYYSYYGDILGLDATMFGSFTAPRIDYKFQNHTKNNIIFKTKDSVDLENWKYTYSVKSYQFPIKKENKISGIKKWNCWIVTITNSNGEKENITSCYKDIK